MKKINVGIIGLGYWGPNLYRNLDSNNNINIIAVADLDKKKFKKSINNLKTIQNHTKTGEQYYHLMPESTLKKRLGARLAAYRRRYGGQPECSSRSQSFPKRRRSNPKNDACYYFSIGDAIFF